MNSFAYVFGRHQKYESMNKLFLCYQAVTALMERFCQNAFAVLRRDGRGRTGELLSPLILLVAACWVWEKSEKKDGRTSHAAIGF
jgi:hypothetical protein